MHPVRQLDSGRLAVLGGQTVTYPQVGATRGQLPPGYGLIVRSRPLASGTDWQSASDRLFAWQVHRAAGLQVTASNPTVVVDAIVVLAIGIGRLQFQAPCRVIYVVDEPDRRGFAYGTLPGHPESGEECFLFDKDERGVERFTITAFSRPATRLAKLGAPISRQVQSMVTNRYLHAGTQP
jgi:uncharacterized protein (UPF0548 family)